MITFNLNNVTTIGSAEISENGDTIQRCLVEVKINGIISQNKILQDVVEFNVPNSVIVGSQKPILDAWEYIKNILAPQWVEDNYDEI